MSADIQITTTPEKFTANTENNFSSSVSVDVKIQNADPDFNEYFYSMDITAPNWLNISGMLESSDALIKGENIFHYDLILAGTPTSKAEDLISFNAEVKISGDIAPILAASLSKDVEISVSEKIIATPEPAPAEIEKEKENEKENGENETSDNVASETDSQEEITNPQTETPSSNSDGQATNEHSSGYDIQPNFETISTPLESPTLDITSDGGKKIILDAMRDVIPDDDSDIEIADITNDPDAEIGTLANFSDIDENSVPTGQKIATVFNRLKITKSKIFVFKGSSKLPAGSPLYFILTEAGFLAGASDTGAVFFDADGNEITATTEENQEFNVAAYISEGEFIPVVTSNAPGTNTANSSGGGCDSSRNEEAGIRKYLIFAVLLLFVMKPKQVGSRNEKR